MRAYGSLAAMRDGIKGLGMFLNTCPIPLFSRATPMRPCVSGIRPCGLTRRNNRQKASHDLQVFISTRPLNSLSRSQTLFGNEKRNPRAKTPRRKGSFFAPWRLCARFSFAGLLIPTVPGVRGGRTLSAAESRPVRSCPQAKRSPVRYPICLRGRWRRSAKEEAAHEQAQG